MPMQRDRSRWSVILVGCSILGALSACGRKDSETPSPPKVPFDAQIVTIDGEQFWEHMYLGARVRVPVGDGAVSSSDRNPSWWIPMPNQPPVQPLRPGSKRPVGIHIRLVERRPSVPEDRDSRTQQAIRQSKVLPDENRADWGLLFFNSESGKSIALGDGYWTPADRSFMSRDGRKLIARCTPYYGNPDGFPERLLCWFEILLSDRVMARVSFNGSLLPDWKLVYDTASNTIQQRVASLEGEPAPNP